jgi:GTP-binding protein
VNAELNAYEEDLLAKPMLVALNKTDIPEAQQNLESLTTELQSRGYTVFAISAVTGAGVPELLQAVAALLREVKEQESVTEKPQELRRYTLESVDERAWSADRLSRHHFVVSGVGIERFTRMTDFSRDEAVERFQRLLGSSGISDELARLGIESGDVVHIANIELVWGDQEDLQPVETNRRGKGSRRTTTADS